MSAPRPTGHVRDDAVLVVRRVAGPTATELAVRARVDGLALGTGIGGGLHVWRAVDDGAARAALAAALRLDVLADAPADGRPHELPERALAEALHLGGGRLRALCLELAEPAPAAARALAALRTATSVTAQGRASSAAAWLDCGAHGTWSLDGAADGHVRIAPVAAGWPRARIAAALAQIGGEPVDLVTPSRRFLPRKGLHFVPAWPLPGDARSISPLAGRRA